MQVVSSTRALPTPMLCLEISSLRLTFFTRLGGMAWIQMERISTDLSYVYSSISDSCCTTGFTFGGSELSCLNGDACRSAALNTLLFTGALNELTNSSCWILGRNEPIFCCSSNWIFGRNEPRSSSWLVRN